jgi:hypothetical protein
MKHFFLLMIVTVVVVMLAITACFGADPYSKYLTVADVEKATGFKNLTVKNVTINLEFYTSDGIKFLEAKFDDASLYDNEVTKNQKYYESVPGIGEKAGIGLPKMPYRLTFLIPGVGCLS